MKIEHGYADGNDFISEGISTVIEESTKIYSTANFKPMTFGVEIQAYI